MQLDCKNLIWQKEIFLVFSIIVVHIGFKNSVALLYKWTKKIASGFDYEFF